MTTTILVLIGGVTPLVVRAIVDRFAEGVAGIGALLGYLGIMIGEPIGPPENCRAASPHLVLHMNTSLGLYIGRTGSCIDAFHAGFGGLIGSIQLLFRHGILPGGDTTVDLTPELATIALTLLGLFLIGAEREEGGERAEPVAPAPDPAASNASYRVHFFLAAGGAITPVVWWIAFGTGWVTLIATTYFWLCSVAAIVGGIIAYRRRPGPTASQRPDSSALMPPTSTA